MAQQRKPLNLMNIQELSLEELNPAAYNPRLINDVEFEGLVESLKTFGQQENLIVNKDMTIVSGHQRYEAMKFLGWEKAMCNVVDLDKKQEKKLNVTMNNKHISGDWDDLKLAEILEELKYDEDYEPLQLHKLEPLDLSERPKKRKLITCPECSFEGEETDFKHKYEEKYGEGSN